MKFLRSALMIVVLACLGLATTACGGQSQADETEQQGKEYTSAYICPMHCDGSGSDAMGQCPVCGMDYVANEDVQSDGHSHDGHDHSHDGHDHGDHSHDGHSH